MKRRRSNSSRSSSKKGSPAGQQVPLIDDSVREIWGHQSYADLRASLLSHSAWCRLANETPLVAVKTILLSGPGANSFVRAYIDEVLLPHMAVDERTKQTHIAGRIWYRYLLVLDELSRSAARVREGGRDEAPSESLDLNAAMTHKQRLLDVAGDSLFRVPLVVAKGAHSFFERTTAPISIGWTFGEENRYAERRLDLGPRYIGRWYWYASQILALENQPLLEEGLLHIIGLARFRLPERKNGWRTVYVTETVDEILECLARSLRGWVFMRDHLAPRSRVFDSNIDVIDFLEVLLRQRHAHPLFSKEEMDVLLTFKVELEAKHFVDLGIEDFAKMVREEPTLGPLERAQWRLIIGNLLVPDSIISVGESLIAQ
jgi:hypothetical protein